MFSVLISALVTVLAAIISSYGFYSYKRFVKAHKLRVALHSELVNLISESITVQQNIREEGRIDELYLQRDKSMLYKENIGNLDLLSDEEIHNVVSTYDLYYLREEFYKVRKDGEEDFKQKLSENLNKADWISENEAKEIAGKITKEDNKSSGLEVGIQELTKRTMEDLEETVEESQDSFWWRIYRRRGGETLDAETLKEKRTGTVETMRWEDVLMSGSEDVQGDAADTLLETIEDYYDGDMETEEREELKQELLENSN